MPNQPVELPEALKRLPPLPQVLTKALELTRDERSRRSELVSVLALDEGMTGYFLRMVNSAYFGLPRRITSLDEALGYLGYEAVEEAIFALSASKTLSAAVPSYLLDREMLWEHSVAVAHGADWLAERTQVLPRSEAYVAGLLHDVGKLGVDLILNREPVWDRAEGKVAEDSAWTELERQVIGHDHAELSAVIVRSWNLPDRVVEAVALHHDPSQAVIDPRFVSVIHIADAAALMAGVGVGVDGLRYPVSEAAIGLLNWDPGEIDLLIGQMQVAVEKAKQILRIRR
ncbi:MAG: HDOD domain-containing protein [Anaerolineae bacterium]